MSTTRPRTARGGTPPVRRGRARRDRRRAAAAAAAAAAATARARPQFGQALYDAEQRGELPEAAALASLGCGNPTRGRRAARGRDGARPRLRRRDRRDPLGEAGRRDRARLRRRHDRRDARARARERGGGRRPNAMFLKGVIEEVPLPADSVDVVISNCVINLSTDKPAVLTEIARVLRPGGRIGDQRRRRRGSAHARGSRRARQLRRLHRRRALEGRVRGRARGSGLRAGQCRVHPRGRRRHARRDRQGREDLEPGAQGPAGRPAGRERRLLLTLARCHRARPDRSSPSSTPPPRSGGRHSPRHVHF